MYGCGKACLILIPLRLPQISCVTLNLKFFSSDSDNCPDVGIGPLLQFPHLPRACPVILTLLFFPLVPSSYWVFRGSIYSFLLVRYSCPLSADVLHALLYLKVCCWCTCGERCTPHPPTPLPSWRRLLRVSWAERDQTSQSWRKPILNIHWKDWCWSWNSNTLPPNAESQLTGKNPDAKKDWRQEEKGCMCGCERVTDDFW